MRVYYLFIPLFLIASCQKDKTFTRKLIDSWEISSSHSTLTDYTGLVIDYTGNYSGEIYFEKNGKGTTDEDPQHFLPTNFTWNILNEKLFIVNSDSTETKKYYIDEFTKTRVYLKHVPDYQPFPEYTARIYITLKRL